MRETSHWDMTSSTCSVQSDKPLRQDGADFTCCLLETRSWRGGQLVRGGSGGGGLVPPLHSSFSCRKRSPSDRRLCTMKTGYLVSRERHDLPAYANNKSSENKAQKSWKIFSCTTYTIKHTQVVCARINKRVTEFAYQPLHTKWTVVLLPKVDRPVRC